MTDKELNAYYERKKKETLDRLLGPGTPYPIPQEVTRKYIDKNWRDGKSWRDQPRILDMSEVDPNAMRWWNDQIKHNGGRIVTYVDPPAKDEDNSKEMKK